MNSIIPKLNYNSSENSIPLRIGLMVYILNSVADHTLRQLILITSRINNKIINKNFKPLKMSISIKSRFRGYLYSKVVYKSGKSAWVWSSYSGVLPQTLSELEALQLSPVPMAWVWSKYKPYFGNATILPNKTSSLNIVSSNFTQTKVCKNQKNSSAFSDKKRVDSLRLIILAAVITFVLI